MLFKVKGGRHIDENNKVYFQGDTVESNSNLCDLFVNKFERDLQAEIDAGKATISASAPKSDSSEKGTKVVNIAKKDSKAVEDVSSDFPEAEPNNIKVVKNSKGYWVIDQDNGNKKPSNKKALELEDVVPFIDSLLV